MCSTDTSFKILIVEDDPILASFMAEVVKHQGHEVAGIAGASEAARNLASPDVDLALVDCNLRDGLTGPDLGRELADRYGITVIFVTSQYDDQHNGIPGAFGVLRKPASVQMIAAAISYGLSLRTPNGRCNSR